MIGTVGHVNVPLFLKKGMGLLDESTFFPRVTRRKSAIAAENAAAEKKTLEEEIASLKADNEIMGAALEEVIAVIAGGE